MYSFRCEDFINVETRETLNIFNYISLYSKMGREVVMQFVICKSKRWEVYVN